MNIFGFLWIPIKIYEKFKYIVTMSVLQTIFYNNFINDVFRLSGFLKFYKKFNFTIIVANFVKFM